MLIPNSSTQWSHKLPTTPRIYDHDKKILIHQVVWLSFLFFIDNFFNFFLSNSLIKLISPQNKQTKFFHKKSPFCGSSSAVFWLFANYWRIFNFFAIMLTMFMSLWNWWQWFFMFLDFFIIFFLVQSCKKKYCKILLSRKFRQN